MIILLQIVAVQFPRVFQNILCYKVRKSNFTTKYDRL